MNLSSTPPTADSPSIPKRSAPPPGALGRVAALAVLVGLGIAGAAMAVPALLPTNDAPAPVPVSTERPWGAAAAEGPKPATDPALAAPNAAQAMALTEAAMPSLLAAMTTEGDVPAYGHLQAPQPADGTRIFSGPIGTDESLTIYSTPGTVETTVQAYEKLLKAHGYKAEDLDFKTEDTAETRLAKSRILRIYTKGKSQLTLTANALDEGGTHLSLLEGSLDPEGEGVQGVEGVEQ